jgi:hypothetical protein
MRIETCAVVHLTPLGSIDGPFAAESLVTDLQTMGMSGAILRIRDESGAPLATDEVLEAIRAAAKLASFPIGLGLDRDTMDAGTEVETSELCRRFGPLFEIRLDRARDASPGWSDEIRLDCETTSLASPSGPDVFTLPIGVAADSVAGPRTSVERFVSLRPSRSWRMGEDDRLCPVVELEQAWFASVGRGETLAIGIPTDRTGRFRPGDVARLAAFRRRIESLFAQDLAASAKVTASSVRDEGAGFGPANALDADADSFWMTRDDDREAWMELSWSEPINANLVELAEPVSLGLRCDAWTLEARLDGTWRELARGTSIGRRLVERFPTVSTDGLRIRLASAGCPPALARFAVYAAPPDVRLNEGEREFRDTTTATLETDRIPSRILYTLDGRDPLEFGTATDGSVAIRSSCLLRAVAVDPSGRAGHPIAARFTRTDGEIFFAAVPEDLLPDRLEPGLELEFHDGVRESLEELGETTRQSVSTIADITLPARRPADHFALVFRGFLRVPKDGLYTFSLRSDDGSRLFLHDRLVVDRDGGQVYEVREGRMGLRRGLHPIRVEFCEFAGRESLSLSWSSTGGQLERIPPDAYSH